MNSRPGFQRVGGHVALDFLNTVSWRGKPAAVEKITGFDVLTGWCRDSGLLSAVAARAIGKAARAGPEAETARVLGQALAGRECLWRMLVATARGDRPAPSDVRAFDRILAGLPDRRGLEFDRGRFRWPDTGAGEGPGILLPLLFWPAAGLLVSGDAARVRICEGPGCGWLFLDRSRGARRRWCAMETCGNRAKARRHYRQHH